jgi:CheY-like chemotaxis protein
VPHAIIIDDNQVGIQVLSHLLEVADVSYTAIQNPTLIEEVVSEALEIDVIFLDLELPHMDGYTVLGYLRNDLGVSAPIIAYTVHTSELPVAKDIGFNGFLGKPLNRETFPSRLQRILNGEHIWEAD